jgi:hypothetical protein
VSWEALPASRYTHSVGEVQAAVRYRLTAATVLFYSLATYGRETLAVMAGPGAVRPTWFDHFAVKGGREEQPLDPRAAAQQEMIHRLETFGERFLLWLRDVNTDRNVSLLKMGALLDLESGRLAHWRSAPVGQIAGDGASRITLDRFVSDCLNDEALLKVNVGTFAADRYLNLFSLAADRFTHKHLNVPRPQARG